MGLTKVVVSIVRKKNKITRVMRMIRTVKMIMSRRVLHIRKQLNPG